MRELAELLRAWLARADTPAIDPQRVENDPNAPEPVRVAAVLLLELAGLPTTLGLPRSVAAALADIELETGACAPELALAADGVRSAASPVEVAEAMWSVFCPDAADIEWEDEVDRIRRRRRLESLAPATDPIRPDQLLLTTNLLLTLPSDLGALPPDERAAAASASGLEQTAWFDHPVPLDTPTGAHELVYGLRTLDEAMSIEFARGALSEPVPVAVSVSATHNDLAAVGIAHADRTLQDVSTPHLAIHAFDEAAAGRLAHQVLGPALARLGRDEISVTRVFGVNGPYGRHYTFLKALAPLWHVCVAPRIRATFKIDLDQVIPQSALLAETGKSALESLLDPAWGGAARDATGAAVSCDFVAGSLVNQTDVSSGLHTLDVRDPGPPRRPEDFVFYSARPQALSTEAEMGPAEGPRQRVHVTGGTTGATVAGLRRSRAFAPSFWGRAEDQAMALSTLAVQPAPVSLHLRDLVLRHDKETFAAAAIDAAAVDKLIGDHERILLFSAHARHIAPDSAHMKRQLAPFTGAFISAIPTTVAYLRLAVTALSWHEDGNPDAARLFSAGSKRLDRTRRFAAGEFSAALAADREGWADFYDALDLIEQGVAAGESWAAEACRAATSIIAAARVAEQR